MLQLLPSRIRCFNARRPSRSPCYRVKGILIHGFDSTSKSMRALFPGSPPRLLSAPRAPQAPGETDSDRRHRFARLLRSQFHTLSFHRARQRKGLRVFALGQRLRRFAEHVATTAGAANSKRVRQWFQEKKAGWYVVLEDPAMPVTSTLLDQAHNAVDRKLFMMKAFSSSQKVTNRRFWRGLAHLYNLVPYQRRAQHAGHCGVEVEGGTVPTRDWLLNLQILTSGGFR